MDGSPNKLMTAGVTATGAALADTGAAGTGAAGSTSDSPALGKTVRSASGLEYAVLREGAGPTAVAGGRVRVHCRGWTVNRAGTEKLFLDTRRAGAPDEYVLSQDSLRTWSQPQVPSAKASLIPGLFEGIVGMRQGESRRLNIPSHLAYGVKGYPRVIPSRTDLVMQVELLSIVPPASAPAATVR